MTADPNIWRELKAIMKTVFMGFQVKSLDAFRIPNQLAEQLSNDPMKQVEQAIKC